MEQTNLVVQLAAMSQTDGRAVPAQLDHGHRRSLSGSRRHAQMYRRGTLAPGDDQRDGKKPARMASLHECSVALYPSEDTRLQFSSFDTHLSLCKTPLTACN